MKKMISALLTAAIAIPAAAMPAAPVFAAGSIGQSDSELTSLLSELKIMTGDGTGDFYLDSYVTRAEMTKVAVASSSYKNTVAAGLQFSPFSDVRGSFWGAPYIQAAVSAGIVEGYIDGTFKPDGTVTYEEAVTMMLKVLGYTNSDFGASYPYGQVGMAQNLDMTDGMDASIGEPLTRRDVAKLVCNTLETRMKDSTSDLITIHDCQIVEDVTIIASQDEDSSLSSDEISTSGGKYKISGDFDRAYVGTTGDMVVKNGKTVIAFMSEDENLSERYVIYSTLNDSILCYSEGNNTALHQFDISGATTCYRSSTAYTYSQLSASMEMGDIIRIHYKDNGEIDYINYSEGTVEGPIKVTSDSWMDSFETDSSTKIVREGNIVSADSIQVNDIIYYSEALNMILAYTTKVTGVYESASPSKDAPSSVTISGVAYELEGASAFNDLSSGGSFNYGDTITVLLGRDGKKIAGVAGTDTASAVSSQVGYQISTGRKNFSNADGTEYSSYYVTIVTADGTEYTYPTTGDRSSLTGRVVRATLKDGTASVGALTNSSLSGYVSYENMKIGTRNVSKDVKILDVASEYNDSSILYTKTFMQRIDGLTLSESQVCYYNTDSNGDISELILRSVTGDMYKYGVITTAYSADGAGVTRMDVDGAVYTSSTFRNLALGAGVRVGMDGTGAIESAVQLPSYGGSVNELTSTYALIGSTKYTLSDKVAVYERRDISNFSKISLNDAVNGDYTYTCYYDKAEERGGRIRVIIAVPK